MANANRNQSSLAITSPRNRGNSRKAAGCKGTQVFRSSEDPNEILVLLEWNDLESARQFAQSQDLREVMQRAGVVGQPDVYFLNDAGRTPA